MSGTSKRKGSAYWSEQVAAHSSSGLSIAAYCEQAGINRHNFVYWRAKLRAEQADFSIQPEGFIALQPRAESPLGSVVIRGRSGIEVEVPSDYPLSGLEGIIRCLSC